MARTRPRVRHLAAGLLALAALAIGGCSVTNPMTTQATYNPSDGVATAVGDVRAGNVLVLTADEGAPGTVLGYLSNDGATDVQVRLEVGGETVLEGDLRAGETILLGPDHTEVGLERSPGAPGSLVPVTVSSAAGSATVQVPVLDATLPQYADMVPDAG